MLTRLTITNFGLIETVDLQPQPGFTALTGETGAGKSMLMDALDVALGGRVEAGYLRAGTPTAEVLAEFTATLTPALAAILEDNGIEPTETLTLRRQLKAENGKATSRAWLNGIPVSAATLAQAGECLVDIHGQHGTYALMGAPAQRAVVDALAGNAKALAETQITYAALQTAQRELEQAQATAKRLAEETDLRTAWLEELAKLGYEPGEEESLLAQKKKLAHAAQIAQHLAHADGALSDEKGAVEALRQASRALGQAAQVDDTLQPLAERLANLLEDARDIAHSIASSANESGVGNAEAIDDRLHELKACARKHRVEVAALPDVQARLEAEQAASTKADQNLAELERTAKAARQQFESACATLTKGRQKVLPSLHKHIHQHLAALLMPNAKVDVRLEPLPPEQWNGEGAERVEFWLAANPGQPMQPLAKAASGGELSRLMLALKSVFAATQAPMLMVLDEIDTGLSGAAASAVGAAMAALSANHQVVSITHHAQVAAKAAHHWKVSKSTAKGQTVTHVEALAGQHREDELARLLSGERLTDAARAAALALLNEGAQHAA
jgi:DNA repair protein RecN (Recombination protein N)